MATFKIAENPQKGVRPTAVEDNGDGTFTSWGYTVWGPVGNTGKPIEGTIVREPKNKKEKDLIAGFQKMIDRAMRSQEALVTAMRFVRERDKN